MFSEIMPAFTEMVEMFIMKTKNSEKRALFSIKCSRGALSIVDKIDNWNPPPPQKKKNYFCDEKEKDEVKLHAALVLNTRAIYEPRRDTQRSERGKGFNDRVSLIFFFCQQPSEKNPFIYIEAKLRRNYN